MSKQVDFTHRMILRKAAKCSKYLDSPLMVTVFMDIVNYQYLLRKLGLTTVVMFANFQSKHEIMLKRNELWNKFSEASTQDQVKSGMDSMMWILSLSLYRDRVQFAEILADHINQCRDILSK
jgi:hypothetical protein